MSNSLAIAAVTVTLQKMLTKGITADLPPDVPDALNLGNTKVTTKPLDKARASNDTTNQINLFLYQTVPNGALRNMEMPHLMKAGETSQPPVALNLHYMLTAYGQNDDDTAAHILLGQAMRIFQDNAVLIPSEIKDALPGSDLHEQIERVRITLVPLSLEEMSKLWTTFQTQYRISSAYQVSVVLIESMRPSRTPLPVLTRGSGDQGALVQGSLTPPYPTIEEVIPPNQQPSAQLGEILTILGHDLDGTNISVRFTSPRLTQPIELAPLAGNTATQIQVTLPSDPAGWPAGLYSVGVIVQRVGESYRRTTNELSVSLAPRITTALPISVARDGNGNATINLNCEPEVRPGQRVSLLLGDQEILAQPHPTQTSALTFIVKNAEPDTYFVRVRIDGVDSLLVNRAVTPPIFFANKKVTIT